MSRDADENGDAYLRTYRSLDEVIERDDFSVACTAQGLPAPSDRMFRHIRSLYRDGHANYIAMNPYDQMRKERRIAWTLERLDALMIGHGYESDRLDFKELISEKTTKKVWAAMANAGGGDVLYGVAEKDGRADSIKPVSFDGVEEQFLQMNASVDPPVRLTLTRIPHGTDTAGVIAIRVGAAARGVVHLVEHRAPVRDGTTTRYMTSEEIRRWVREGERPSGPAD